MNKYISSTFCHLMALLFLLLFTLVCQGEELPLWEIGAGGGVLHVPVYRGSKQTETFPYPFIIPFYRGKYLYSDEDGIRGEIIQTTQYRFDFSLDGSVPAKSKDLDVRRGMPDLDPSFQIGPALNIKLWSGNNPRQSIIALLPIRAAFALNSSILDPIGFTFSPQLSYYRKIPFIKGDWKLGLTGSLQFGSEKYHDYFYQVDEQYATSVRPAYNAEGGYGGYRIIATFHHRIKNTWISLFGRYDRVDNAVFEDSPLVDSNGGLTVGFLVTWFFYHSKSTVEVIDWKYESKSE